jgi:hypothetical protein
VITAYQNKEISDSQARSKLSELNKRSIMTPKMLSLLDKVNGAENEDVTKKSDEELKKILGID